MARVRHLLLLLVALCCCLHLATCSPLSTHILDTTAGRPAANVTISVHRLNTYREWRLQDKCVTDVDGRCSNLLDENCFKRGLYMLYFETGNYFNRTNTASFFPYVKVVLEIMDPSQHYHISLLFNPFSYSTYRGS